MNMLEAREEFIKMCNDRFGWNASVHFKGSMKKLLDALNKKVLFLLMKLIKSLLMVVHLKVMAQKYQEKAFKETYYQL